ncbi:MAG: ribosome maturation factor [Thermoflavifilum sp.]|nr:ribosome maturation factor [Thermoflavifilum sp.]
MHQPEDIRQVIQELVEQELQLYPDCFLVDLVVNPDQAVRIFIDSDTGISIDRLAQINRALSRMMVDKHIFPNDDFSLEVSSPGVDTPLKFYRQYPKNIGRTVVVTLHDNQSREGVLQEVNPDFIVLDVKKNKNEHQFIKIPFTEIRYTRVQIRF